MKNLFIATGLTVLAVIGVGLVWFYYVPLYTAKEAIRLKLNDPDSAQFRNMRRLHFTVVCGEVNAKSAMGGYTGFTAFSVTDPVFSAFSTSPAAKMHVAFARDIAPFSSELHRELAALENKLVKDSCEL